MFLSGSATFGNTLFDNPRAMAANQLGLNPVVIAAANSSGGVMSKMISPQNIETGVSMATSRASHGQRLDPAPYEARAAPASAAA